MQAGYARNFLVPTGKAKVATKENIAEVEARRAELEQLARERLDAATMRKSNSRLSCQIEITEELDGLLVHVAPNES